MRRKPSPPDDAGLLPAATGRGPLPASGHSPRREPVDRHGAPLTQYYLRPGELHVATEPTLVTTLLGSCVSVTMHAPGRDVGAICHALLPEGEPLGKGSASYRYLSSSVRIMVDRLRALGISPPALEVKAFGGADVIRGRTGGPRPSIGRQNLEATHAALLEAGLRLSAQDLGGERGRKLLFYTDTGEVFIKRLARQGGGTAAASRAAGSERSGRAEKASRKP